jgi:hypothetical protein
MDPERRLSGRNGWGGNAAPLRKPFWREGGKSREREGRALAFNKATLPYLPPFKRL